MQHLNQDLNQSLNDHSIQQYLIQLNQQKDRLRNLKKKSPLKFPEHFVNEIVNNEKDINDETFRKYFDYQNPSVLSRDLLKSMEVKNEWRVNEVNDAFIDLRIAAIRKKFLKMKILRKKLLTVIMNKKVKYSRF